MTKIEKKQNLLSGLTMRQLCDSFEQTNNMDSDTIPMVRGWLMDELEKRDPGNFDIWMESDITHEIDNPSFFFCS
jgi:hypothetical protein